MTQPSFFECSGTPSSFVVSGTPNWDGVAPVKDGSTAPLQSGGGVDAAVLGVLAPGDVPDSGSGFPFFMTLHPIAADKSRRTMLGGSSIPDVGGVPGLSFDLSGVGAGVAAAVATSVFLDLIESISSLCFFKSAFISPFWERMRWRRDSTVSSPPFLDPGADAF